MAEALTSPSRAPLVARGTEGRAFTASRRVRWGDVDRHRRLRLDGIARYLQDIANDDARDAGIDQAQAFVVRRTVVDVVTAPRPGEVVALTTFCGGLGSRWAERRTTITGDAGGHVEAASLWIAIDAATGRPARLGPDFTAVYGTAAGGRTVSASLRHGAPLDRAGAAPGQSGEHDAARRPWPLRSTDHDPLGHVNNAATWEPVEDELDRRGLVPVRAEVEYRAGIDPTDEVELVAAADGDVLAVWLLAGPVVRASALVLTTPRRTDG